MSALDASGHSTINGSCSCFDSKSRHPLERVSTPAGKDWLRSTRTGTANPIQSLKACVVQHFAEPGLGTPTHRTDDATEPQPLDLYLGCRNWIECAAAYTRE